MTQNIQVIVTPQERAERLAWHVTQAVDDLKTLLERNPRTDFTDIETDLDDALHTLTDACMLASFHRRMREIEPKIAEMLGDKYTRLALVEEHGQRLDLRDQLEPFIHAAALQSGYDARFPDVDATRIDWLAGPRGAYCEEDFYDRWNATGPVP